MRETPDFNAISLTALRRRRGTKWTRYPPDVLPAWVADMDFDMAEPIRAGLAGMMDANDLGYAPKLPASGLPEAFAAFAARRFPGWEVAPERMIAIADIVQGIHLAIEAYTRPGDGVCTLTPVYPPFLQTVAETGRRLDDCTMVRGEGRYEIDFDSLRAAIDERTRLLLLCTPHNPLGRVFDRDELETLARIAIERDLVVVADEIHADIVYPGSRHIPFASLGPEVEARTVTMTSATKSFNIAGLRCAVVLFGSDRLAERFNAWPERIRGAVSSFGMEATRIAWTECDEWLEEIPGQGCLPGVPENQGVPEPYPCNAARSDACDVPVLRHGHHSSSSSLPATDRKTSSRLAGRYVTRTPSRPERSGRSPLAEVTMITAPASR